MDLHHTKVKHVRSYQNCWKGHTIHSAGQIEWHKNNRITCVGLHGGNDDSNPMNCAIAHFGFLLTADFMIAQEMTSIIWVYHTNLCTEELYHESSTFLGGPTLET